MIFLLLILVIGLIICLSFASNKSPSGVQFVNNQPVSARG
jgi:hypothetical protein